MNAGGSKIGRIPNSPSEEGPRKSTNNCISCWQRSTTSSFDISSKIAKPPIISLVSAKGPSITEIFPVAARTRTPHEVGRSRPTSTIVPRAVSSSTIFFETRLQFSIHRNAGFKIFVRLSKHHESHSYSLSPKLHSNQQIIYRDFEITRFKHFLGTSGRSNKKSGVSLRTNLSTRAYYAKTQDN